MELTVNANIQSVYFRNVFSRTTIRNSFDVAFPTPAGSPRMLDLLDRAHGVSNFPGYISCDDDTVSEIVVPVIKSGELIAVLDIDGDQSGQFDEIDQAYLEKLVSFI